MKKLVCLLVFAVAYNASAQSYIVKNANLDYVVTNLNSNLNSFNISKKDPKKIIRDKQGLTWFQCLSELFSFDGVNWKSYSLKSANGKTVLIRINEIEVTDDGGIWLATEDGIYTYDPQSESFISVRKKIPGLKDAPLAVANIRQYLPGTLVLTSIQQEGFYLFEWQAKKIKQITIDPANGVIIPADDNFAIATDKKGNLWGITFDKRGIWNYNHFTGKVACSWKGELPLFAGKRFQSAASIIYSETEQALWISYGVNGYLEKINLLTGKSVFYSFSGNLMVHPDTTTKNRLPVYQVKIDSDNNAWVRAGEKYLVKLNTDISAMKYLADETDILPIGNWHLFSPENSIGGPEERNNLLWIAGTEKISIIKQSKHIIRHMPFDTISATGIQPKDYENTDGRKNIFFVKGKDDQYYLLQQDPGRPKLICLDNNLNIKHALFKNEWAAFPAYFSPDFDPDTFYLAIMRRGDEPLDFRTVVTKDFRVDLHTYKVEEMNLNFSQRVWRYGCADATNTYWLFSNGFLYSYEPGKNKLDSIYICKPAEKRSYPRELIKGYDYPTVLHKNSSTFWIDFIPTKELYKINLNTKKIEKIFKFCIDQKDCFVTGGVYDMYNFDTGSIYIQKTFSAMLLHPRNDSLTDFFELFNNKLPTQMPSGSGRYKNWIYYVLPSYIYFLNTVSGERRSLALNNDFKWKTSQFNSPPLVNDRGEMIVMSSSNKGFLVFNIDAVPAPAKPGIVHLSFIKLDNEHLSLDSLMKKRTLSLQYNEYSSIHIGFSDLSVFDQDRISYEYTLYKGGDTTWNSIEGMPELNLSELSPGKYQLLFRAANGYGDYSAAITAFPLVIIPPFWQTWWFRALVLAVIGGIFYGLYRYRMQQMARLQRIRNNIASDLHDDIGSTLNSISIYSQVAKQQAGKDIPALDLIGINSRKIIENMSDIVWTINPENDSFEKIIVRMRSFAYQLLKAKKIEYTFEADEKLNSIVLPMQVRKNFYLVFKEAITNLVKYSEASRVFISLSGDNKMIFLRIRDNGKGIPDNAETQGNGLMNMKRRAAEINASLNIRSNDGEGTSIELMLKT